MTDKMQTDDHIIITTLTLLGLDPLLVKEIDKSHAHKSCMKISQKSGNEIIHFLFSLIDKRKSQNLFRDCWPIIDKKMESAFRNMAYSWYKELNQNKEFGKPKVIASIAAITPGSNKFRKTVLALTTCAMRNIIKVLDSSSILLLPPNATTTPATHCIDILTNAKLNHFTNFANEEKHQKESLIKYHHLFRNSISNLDQLEEDIKEKESEIYDELTTLSLGIDLDTPLNEIIDNATDVLQCSINQKNDGIKNLLSDTTHFYDAIELHWNVINPLLESGEISVIDGDDMVKSLGVDAKQGYPHLFIDENLDLISVLKAGRPFIQKMVDKNLPNPKEMDAIDELMSRLKSTDDEFEEVKMNLNKTSQEMIKNVSLLREQVHEIFKDTSHNDDFELCPPTPPYQLKCKGSTDDSMDECERSMTSYERMKSNTERTIISSRILRSKKSPNWSLPCKALFNSRMSSVSPKKLPPTGDSAFLSDLDSFVSNKLNEKEAPLKDITSFLTNQDSGCIGVTFESSNSSIKNIQSTSKKSVSKNESKSENAVFKDGKSCTKSYFDDYLNSFEAFLNDIDQLSLKDTKQKVMENTVVEQENEFFDVCDNRRCSNVLNPTLLFQTVTESIIAGELQDNLLTDEIVSTEVNEEDFNLFRRQSLLGRISPPANINKSFEEPNILDESESCLIKSFED